MSDRPLEADRDELRAWLRTWEETGPLLEAERWRRLRAMSPQQATHAVLDLLQLAQPHRDGDNGEGLPAAARVFRRAPQHVP